MTYITYSQNFEDVMLMRALKDVEVGFYIDIGAWHPSEHSVTKVFYDLGWSGINVEPTSKYFELLQRARPRDQNLKVLIGATHGAAKFYEIDGAGLSTVNYEDAQRHKQAGWASRETEVPMMTLSGLIEQYANDREIDFLKIDVEGNEEAVIESCDWAVFRPKILVIEAIDSVTLKPRWGSWEQRLIDSKYLFAWFDGVNRFYVRAENRELLKYFAEPPNIFDDFQLSTKSVFRPRWTTRLKLRAKRLLPDRFYNRIFPSRRIIPDRF